MLQNLPLFSVTKTVSSHAGSELVMHFDKLVKHENYNPASKDYDIALLHLDTRVKFTRTRKPICLAANADNYPAGKKCMVAGWGYRHEWLLGGPEKLHAVQVWFGLIAFSLIISWCLSSLCTVQTCCKKCEESICQLSVIPGKKAKGITTCGHIERKDQGRTA